MSDFKFEIKFGGNTYEVKKVGIILLAKGKFSVIVKRFVSRYEEKNSEKKEMGSL